MCQPMNPFWNMKNTNVRVLLRSALAAVTLRYLPVEIGMSAHYGGDVRVLEIMGDNIRELAEK